MKKHPKVIFIILLAFLLSTAAAIFYTRGWSNYRQRIHTLWLASKHPSEFVDTHALDTAQQLASLAVTPLEKNYAAESLRIGDHSVDLAFAAALADATNNPPPLTPETRALSERIQQVEVHVAADQDRVKQLTQQMAKVRADAKDALQQELDQAQTQLTLDQDELDDAHDDLVRAGGDKHAKIQQLLDQHKASEAQTDAHAISENSVEAAIETTISSNCVAQIKAWKSLHAKEKLLQQAQQDALARETKLSAAHEVLEKQLSEEKSQQKILHPAVSSTESQNNANAGSGSPSNTALSFVKQLSADQKNLLSLNQRIGDEQQIAANYGNWITVVTAREQSFLHGLLTLLFWIFLIALCVFAGNEWVQTFFLRRTGDRRQLHTARILVSISMQVFGVVLILLIIFGVPNNFGTVAALVTAGVTVALKDFIVGFFGWFILMGKGGIRPGDWVEINGVGGEVLKVGLLRTVLLETGNWADAGHPTGRKVTFVNSFAIEGHYFNFSTSGQWLWDELQIQVPASADPYATAEAIQKIVTDETAANARLAEEEWERVTPGETKRSFSAAPSMTVRPSVTGPGVDVLLRYITRANERHEVRARLYRAVVDLLHRKGLPESAPKTTGPSLAEQK